MYLHKSPLCIFELPWYNWWSMSPFTKTFFHFALGFIEIIVFSAAVIIVTNTLHEPKISEGDCLNCASQ